MDYNWLMTNYNWQQNDWPHFRYELASVYDILLAIAEKAGLIQGKIAHLMEDQQTETMIDLMVEEAVKTSEIEGEFLNRPDVRSSIRNQLGLNVKTIRVHDKRAKGIAELMLDVNKTFKQALTAEKLFDWHLMLLSGSTNFNLSVGYWRTHKETMEIVSEHNGRRITHFEAPPSAAVPKAMEEFISWFNITAPGAGDEIKFAPVRAAIAHLYFETIHPFEDGNGRIGRAIAEKALSQGFGYPAIISLSQAINAKKKLYYSTLHLASKSNEITEWINYFLHMILESQTLVEKQINFILSKSKFFDAYGKDINERQLKVLSRMLETGVKGFEGGMSAKKYMAITNTSKATATRDLQDLLTRDAIKQIGSGRSVRYEINLEL
jgi:Fic family protein